MISLESISKRPTSVSWRRFKWAVKDKIVYSWLSPLKAFVQNCKRVIKWLPIIWVDRDWDWTYILLILETKIRFTREQMTNYSLHCSTKEDCINMKKAEAVLRRLRSPENYIENDWEKHQENWPRGDIFDDDFVFTPPTEEASKDVRRMMDKVQYMWKQDINWLSKHLQKHLQKWWY
jgi:hypothetical protein